MAQINSRLQSVAADLFIKYNSTEREYIEDKISNLKTNLKAWFGNSISEILVFGSYKRDTILPRRFDDHSDVDILVSDGMQIMTIRLQLMVWKRKLLQ
jgi:predicted nucleotidyltransferase